MSSDKEAPKPAPKIGDVARRCIREGMSNKQALAVVLKEIPTAKTTEPCIAWYRNDMRKKGEVFRSPGKAGKGDVDMSKGAKGVEDKAAQARSAAAMAKLKEKRQTSVG